MKPKKKSENWVLNQFNNHAATGTIALLLLVPLAARGGGVVTDCTEANLRAAMSGGGLVTFASDGTITLAGTITNETDTVLDGTGHQVTLSGNNAVTVLQVNSGTHLTVAKLTIANGLGLWGGGIYNETGTVDLVSVTLRNNVATNAVLRSAEGGNGGGIYNQGTLNATNCLFTGNAARQRDTVDYFPGFPDGYISTPCLGGAIYNDGQLNLFNCSFNGNGASAAPGYQYWMIGPCCPAGASAGRKAAGGAIFSRGLLTVSFCTFATNAASSGWSVTQPATSVGTLPGLAGTEADGGAICSLGPLAIHSSSFIGNRITGGAGGGGGGNGSGVPGDVGGLGGAGNGGAIFNGGGGVIANCALIGNVASGGPGGSGGYGTYHLDLGFSGGPGGGGGGVAGGALFNGGTLSLVNCTVAGNSAAGGAGGTGGAGSGGPSRIPANGGNGGTGGIGSGAVSDTNGLVALTNCTFALNLAAGGVGGSGGPAGSMGQPGATGTNGTARGGLVSLGATLINCLLATNVPANCHGSLNDAGHNLSSDGACAFTSAGSLNNTDPKLGPLANNGGPTLTMALLPDSPAIDAGDNSAAPLTDQRGIPRPVGSSADIGAYEFTAVLQISRTQASEINVLVYGPCGQSCRLLRSADLSDWQCVSTNQIGANGTVLFQDNCGTGNTQRFYKVALP
jgi:hypothetical protein